MLRFARVWIANASFTEKTFAQNLKFHPLAAHHFVDAASGDIFSSAILDGKNSTPQ